MLIQKINDTNFYCFIHIEKCAGTTFSHSLKYNIPGYLSLKPWYYWSNEPGNFLSAKELKYLLILFPFLKGIGGHTTRTFAGYESVVNKEIKYFTFVRNPIARYMSHYNHQVNKMGIDWKLDEFIKEERFNNYMTRRIAGEANLAKAIERIEEDFSFVGLFEKYDESIVLMNQFVFNGKLLLYYERKNDSLYEKKLNYNDLDNHVKENIMKNNLLDLELYKYIKNKIYPKFISRYSGNLKNDLEQFLFKNSTYRYRKVRYYLINSTRLITENLIEQFAHKVVDSSK